MLPSHEIEIQAQAFVSFAAKRDNRGIAIDPLFLRWFASKDFTAEDSFAIWRVVRVGRLRARGRALPTASGADADGAGRHRRQEHLRVRQ
jgi:hypothetical protein